MTDEITHYCPMYDSTQPVVYVPGDETLCPFCGQEIGVADEPA